MQYVRRKAQDLGALPSDVDGASRLTWYLRAIYPYWPIHLGAAISACGTAASALCVSLSLKGVVDAAMRQHGGDAISFAVVGLILAYAGQSVFAIVGSW